MCNQILQSSNISPTTPTFWLNVRLLLTKSAWHSIGAQVARAKLAYVIRSQVNLYTLRNLRVISQSKPRGATHRNRLKFRRHKDKTSGQFISIYFSFIVSRNLYHRIPTQTLIWHPRVMSQLLYYLYGKDVPSSKTGPQKVHCRSREKTTLAVVVSEQCTSQGSLRNRQKIYHTPHFPYPAFSVLHIFRTPHFLSTSWVVTRLSLSFGGGNRTFYVSKG